MNWKTLWCVAFGLCVIACGNDSNKGGPGRVSALQNPCGSQERSSVGWDEQTPLGVSPAQAFADFSRTCTSAFTWDSSRDDELTVTPASGMSNVAVKVDVDQSSVKLITSAKTGSYLCEPWLEVSAQVHVNTDDGTFAETGTATVRYDAGGINPISFTEQSSDIGGSLSIKPKDGKTGVELSYQVGPFEQGCAGEISLDTWSSSGNMVSGASGGFASWSSTGCKVGEKSVGLDAGIGNAPPLSAEAMRAWKQATYSGTWDDGSSTELTLSIGALPPAACGRETSMNHTVDQISFPVQVTYQTTDGRVAPHTASATLYDLRFMLHLGISEDFACSTRDSTLPYSLADCNALSRINVLVGLDFTPGVGAIPDTRGGSLTVSEYGKNAPPGSSSADTVHTLRF